MDDLELLVAGANAMIQDQEIGNAVFVAASRELLRRTAIIREIEEAVARQALERAKRSDSPD